MARSIPSLLLLLALPISALLPGPSSALAQAAPPSASTLPAFGSGRQLLRELPRLDVYVDGVRVVDSLAAPQVGPLTLREPGKHTVAVVPAGQRLGRGTTLSARADTAYANERVYVVFFGGLGVASVPAIGLSRDVPDPAYALTFTF